MNVRTCIAGAAVAIVSLAASDAATAQSRGGKHTHQTRQLSHIRSAHAIYRTLRINVATTPPSGGTYLCPRPGDPDASCRSLRSSHVELIEPPSPLQPLGSAQLRPPIVPATDSNQVFIAYRINKSGAIMAADRPGGGGAGWSVPPYLSLVKHP